MIKRSLFLLLSLVAMVNFQSCVNQEFDEPPVADLPGITANATIEDVKNLHAIGGDDTFIENDLIIEGEIVGDDRSGNLYKQIVIQDATGGIVVRINGTGLSATYPVGNKLIVKCQGLYVGDYNGLLQINGAPDAGIEPGLAGEYLFSYVNDAVTPPTELSIADMNDATKLERYTSTLVSFTDVQFASGSYGVTFADPINLYSENRDLEDCNGNTVIVRSSGYADFAATLTPEGKGTFIGIVSVYNDTPQLLVREPAELEMDGARCGGSTGTEQLVSISDLRAAFNSGNAIIDDERKIKGIVISDGDNGNIHSQNLVLQEGNSGIVVRFDSDHSFNQGDEIEVVVSGVEMSEYNGLLQISTVALSGAVKISDATEPSPVVKTVSEVLAELETLESTLVRINGATLSGGATYGDGITVTDATGSISLYTRSAASFADNAIAGGEIDIIAIVSQFNDAQLNIRNLDDIIGGTTGGGDEEPISAADLKTAFTGGSTAVPANKKITAVVISDAGNGNTHPQNAVVQDASGGIVLRFTGDHGFALGEEIEVVISGLELSEYNGLLQVNNIPNANATSNGAGTMPTPQVVTIADIIANSESLESTLVTINGISVVEGGTWNGPKTLTDGTSNLAIYTRSQASFANDNVPAGSFNITGMVSQYNDVQLNIRNSADIQ